MIDDWIKFSRHYVARDLAYIIGGTSLLLCFNYLCPNTKSYIFSSDISITEYLFIAGVAYVFGYLVQDLFCIVFPKFFATSIKKLTPSKFMNRAYERYTQTKVDWEILPDYDEDVATIFINLERSERNQAELERLTAHFVMCTAIGSCWLIVGVILLFHSLIVIIKHSLSFDFCSVPNHNWKEFIFSLTILTVVICLIVFGKLKSLRMQKFRWDLIKAPKELVRELHQSQRATKESPEPES